MSEFGRNRTAGGLGGESRRATDTAAGGDVVNHRTRALKVTLALAVPVLGLIVVGAPAGAHKTTSVGNVTCSYGDTMTFNPPLSGGSGTAGFSKEVITVAPASLGSCTGTVTSGAVPSVGAGAKAKAVKIKGSKIDGIYYAGGCPNFVNYMWSTFKSNYNWTATGLTLKGSKVANVSAAGSSNPSTGDLGFVYSGTATGSFSGPVSIDAYFTDSSSAALQNCVANVGTVSSLTVDPAQSSVTVG